jgi:outer membrane protein assembly factor BamE
MHPSLCDQRVFVPSVRFRLAVMALCASLPLGACNLLTAHKIDVQQGNVVTQEMVDKLKPGMTRAQVRFVLGTPLITDAFHRDRWDYFYSFKVGAQGVAETRRLTLTFQNDVLRSVQGDVAVKSPETAPPNTSDKPAS